MDGDMIIVQSVLLLLVIIHRKSILLRVILMVMNGSVKSAISSIFLPIMMTKHNKAAQLDVKTAARFFGATGLYR